MSTRSFQDWLDHQLTLHPRGIDLGLDRVRAVGQRLFTNQRPASTVITVAGTNGKGSTIAFLEALALAHGVRVACYTSPHLFRYTERVRLNGQDSSEEQWLAAFEAVEQARGDISLSYFEFGTLAALWIMHNEALDLALLEVGLGGRLDAVNIIDADVAVITSIGLDHQDYLGDSLEAIAREKAGIMRKGKPVIIAASHARDTLLACAAQVGALPLLAERDYSMRAEPGGTQAQWHFDSKLTAAAGQAPLAIAELGLSAPCQPANAAAALMAWACAPFSMKPERVAAAFVGVSIGARLQEISQQPRVVVDIAHNPQAAQTLALWLQQQAGKYRNVRAVFGALEDKDSIAMLEPLLPLVDVWHLCGLPASEARGMPLAALKLRHGAQLAGLSVTWHEDVAEAKKKLARDADADELIVVFGCFAMVRAVQPWSLDDTR